jgi:cell division protein FtsX
MTDPAFPALAALLLPACAFVVLGVVAPLRRLGRPAAYLSIVFSAAALVAAIGALRLAGGGGYSERLWTWIPAGDLTVDLGFHVDQLTSVLLIVVNSIRMAVMSRAQEIEIMRLVGASVAFVRWPFIFEGLIVGLMGALITLCLLLLASRPIVDLANAIAGQVPVGFSESLTTQVAVLVLAAGLGLGGVGAWISVRAYLRRA